MEEYYGYNEVKFLYDKLGGDDFLEYFKICYPQLDLFSFSLSWTKTEKYILKFVGLDGDLIVRWL